MVIQCRDTQNAHGRIAHLRDDLYGQTEQTLSMDRMQKPMDERHMHGANTMLDKPWWSLCYLSSIFIKKFMKLCGQITVIMLVLFIKQKRYITLAAVMTDTLK